MINTFFDNLKNKILKNKATVFCYFFILNLPLIFLTFDTTNWSDDYQLMNLMPVYAKMTSIFSVMFELVGGDVEGGHFGPIYILWNYCFTLFSSDPRFVHFLILLMYITTSWCLYLFVVEYFKDKVLGLVAGTLFALNYHISFKAITWNCFHSHATNTLTGIVSMLFLAKYINSKKKIHVFFSGLFLLFSIHNLESGFVFLPILFVILVYARLTKSINNKKVVGVAFVYGLVLLTYPVGSYLSSGKWNPLGHRFQREKTIQGYAFNANELFVKSLGLSKLYNEFVFDAFKQDEQLKEAVIAAVRNNNLQEFKQIDRKRLFLICALGILTIFLAIFLLMLILTRIRRENKVILVIFGILFCIYTVIFYRVDIANALALFSSIILADVLISLRKDPLVINRSIGMLLIILLTYSVLWSVYDRFDDCYRKSYFGLQKIAIQGPDKIYRRMNQQIGKFADKGVLLFSQDYRQYHRTTGFKRIGDTLSMKDFLSFNTAVFSNDFFERVKGEQYKGVNFIDFTNTVYENFNVERIVVDSKEDAEKFMRDNGVDAESTHAFYLTKDYQLVEL